MSQLNVAFVKDNVFPGWNILLPREIYHYRLHLAQWRFSISSSANIYRYQYFIFLIKFFFSRWIWHHTFLTQLSRKLWFIHIQFFGYFSMYSKWEILVCWVWVILMGLTVINLNMSPHIINQFKVEKVLNYSSTSMIFTRKLFYYMYVSQILLSLL